MVKGGKSSKSEMLLTNFMPLFLERSDMKVENWGGTSVQMPRKKGWARRGRARGRGRELWG